MRFRDACTSAHSPPRERPGRRRSTQGGQAARSAKLRHVSSLSDPGDEIAPRRVAELLAAGEVELIDVREPYEREAGYIEGSRHVPLDRLSEEAPTIGQDKPVVFQCRVGGRSAMATQAFRASGREAYNLVGGILAWVDAGLPIAPDDGHVAEH